MTDFHAHLDEIAALLDQAGIDELELSGPDLRLRLVRNAEDRIEIAPLVNSRHAAVAPIRSSGVGVFLDRHPWSDEPLACSGQFVEDGAILGFLRVGTLLTAIRAPFSGHLVDLHVRTGDIVGFGDVLAELEAVSSDPEP